MTRFAQVADTGRAIGFHNDVILLTMDVICQVIVSPEL